MKNDSPTTAPGWQTAARPPHASARQRRGRKNSGRVRWLLLGMIVGLALLAGLRPVAPADAAFPGANGLIAFHSNRDGGYDIFVMNPDGSNPTNLTDQAGNDQYPAWSADGTQIAFQSDREGNDDIYLMDADGNNPTNLTNNDAFDSDPAWSPDGTQIAFSSDRDDDFEIYVMDADGSSPTNLTNNEVFDNQPAWSPDGTQIAFSSDRNGETDIYVMDADGSNQIRLTNNEDSDIYPAWSPDGSQIVFSSDRDDDWEVYVMDADGSNQIRLTNSKEWDLNPAWSPDGTQIVFHSFRDNDWEVYVMDADGNNQTNLTNYDGKLDFFPDWQPLPLRTEVYLTAAGPGMTGNGVNFGKEDILEIRDWETVEWQLFFDGSVAGLTNKHDLNAVHVEAADDLYLSFFQNKIKTANLGNVFGHDILHYDGSDFSLFFDGSDVGLTTTAEKIDALHILDDGTGLPGGGSCGAYLLISTLGTGKVPAFGGGNLKFQGEDILGFCLTNSGDNTAGFWHLVLDGSAEGMPKNSTDSISASEEGETIYLTTQAKFNVDSASGSHSMVYEYDTTTNEFSGPLFSAPASGLGKMVDGLHVVRGIP